MAHEDEGHAFINYCGDGEVEIVGILDGEEIILYAGYDKRKAEMVRKQFIRDQEGNKAKGIQ